MPASPQRRRAPIPLPAQGRPARVAFVGHRGFHEPHALTRPAGGLEPAFVDYRDRTDAGRLEAQLAELAPHAVIVFRPESIPPGLFRELPAAVLGIACDPLPRPGERRTPGAEWAAAALAEADPANFDRVALVDGPGWESAPPGLPLWRAMPLPVDDRFFRPLRPARPAVRAIAIGASTPYLESRLLALKHEFDIGHYAHGLIGDELERALGRADAGIAVNGEPVSDGAFGPSVLLHLAAGHLLLAEPVRPTYGLEPEIDFLRVRSAEELSLRLHQLIRDPGTFGRVRVRGRAKAEQFRASIVWPRLVQALLEAA